MTLPSLSLSIEQYAPPRVTLKACHFGRYVSTKTRRLDAITTHKLLSYECVERRITIDEVKTNTRDFEGLKQRETVFMRASGLLNQSTQEQEVIVGDVQGCVDSLNALIEQVESTFGDVRYFFAGDLINRGPSSVETLKRVAALSGQSVLGNHEIYFLAVSAGIWTRKSDTLQDLFDLDSKWFWVDWIRRLPLILPVRDGLLVHAGIPTDYSKSELFDGVRQLEQGLSGEHWQDFLSDVLLSNSNLLSLKSLLSFLTRVRTIEKDGQPNFRFKGELGSLPAHLRPWYESYDNRHGRIYFGHWAAHGIQKSESWLSLDSGCVWGRSLSAYSIAADTFISVPGYQVQSSPAQG